MVTFSAARVWHWYRYLCCALYIYIYIYRSYCKPHQTGRQTGRHPFHAQIAWNCICKRPSHLMSEILSLSVIYALMATISSFGVAERQVMNGYTFCDGLPAPRRGRDWSNKKYRSLTEAAGDWCIVGLPGCREQWPSHPQQPCLSRYVYLYIFVF